MTDTWEDEGGLIPEEDWPYDEDWENEEEILENWDELDEIDDYQYIEEDK